MPRSRDLSKGNGMKWYESRDLFKTEFCHGMAEQGWCRWGEKCHFAHSSKELRERPKNNKFKTEPCQNYHTPGKTCRFGRRCEYFHDISEKRVPGFRKPTIPPSPTPSTNLPLEIWQHPDVETLSATPASLCSLLYMQLAK